MQLSGSGEGYTVESDADDVVAMLMAEDSPSKDLILASGSGDTPLVSLSRTVLTGGVERAVVATADEVVALLEDHPLIEASGAGSVPLQPQLIALSGGGENFLVETQADEVVSWLTETNSPARNLITVTGGGTHALEALPRTALSGGRVHQSTTQASQLVTLLQNTSSVSSVLNVSGGGEHELAPMTETHLRGVTSASSLSTTYTWTSENRLAGVTRSDAKSYGYTYDYRIRRVGTVSEESGQAAKHTAILFSGGLSVAEYEGSSLQTQITTPAVNTVNYVRGPDMGGGVGGLLYSTRTETGGGKKVRYNLSNGRGDIVAQSDESATLTWTASYEAYGKRPTETGTNQDKQRANSKDEDPTGLLNEGFRYRDIETGVWLSRDPAGFVDGPNLYAYVKQNPWTAFDPDGLSANKILKTEKAITRTAKALDNGVTAVRNRIINSKYGKTGIKPLEDFSEDSLNKIRKIDPEFKGQKFSPEGYPIFDDHAFKIGDESRFPIPGMKGNKHMAHDNNLIVNYLINERNLTPEKARELLQTHTLHHIEGGTHAQLVPKAIHAATAHSGGTIDIIKQVGKEGLVGAMSIIAPNTVDAFESGGAKLTAMKKDIEESFTPVLSFFSDAEKYARNVDIMGSLENLMVNGTFSKPKPLY